ncbi:MAG: prolyl oligopeptidase family serine peptidase [Actinomycetia bacterium]|nr:prolyl oligopeptidase family serine peptidase [Actinomycetes bacterium]MCP4227845.1 prolyl oligopeptidase family serine peptidase [Actinomycetes bacterium]MCP5030711.1 prolyl oligopeptidase family serine peptidase [Actinomycetes bacterium]
MRSLPANVPNVRDWMRGHTEADLPGATLTPLAAMKWLTDEWAMQIELASGRVRVPDSAFRRRLRDELAAARQLYEASGWLADPRSYHRDPPPLVEVSTAHRSIGLLGYEHVRFVSEFEPWPDEPGRERWLDYRPVRTGHAWMLRHEGRPRPWIILVNGYRTGDPAIDLASFRAQRLHHKFGLNVLGVVLPLHGPRAIDANGGRVLHAGAMNTVFTVTQGAWDIRRLLSWIRSAFDAETIAITGISLGGYMASLMTALDDDLAGVIAGVPEADLVRGIRRQMDLLLPPYYEQWGLSWEPLEQVFKVVSPLAMPCLVAKDRRYIYAGLLDRWVRPGNVRDLWEHWDRPEILWYNGSHLSFPFESSVRQFVDRAIEEIFAVESSATGAA